MALEGSSGTANVDRSIALFERPTMEVVDQPTFTAVKQAIQSCFSSSGVTAFLRSLDRAGLRIRNFESVLSSGKLGAGTAADYGKLTNADQGQIREFYLASLEEVELGLRDKFFKLYSYY